MRLVIIPLLFLLLAPLANAQRGHLYLLAVSEGESSMSGSIADLYLEIKPGTGQIFIATYPLTKLDTQISTRFAQEIACKTLDIDCSNYDFFYTISSSSAIVGGPSAGTAIAVLTASMLSKAPVNEKIAITGTINAGGLVGPVGGLKEKIEAAAGIGLTEVLIPKGTRQYTEDNVTTDLITYGKSIGIEVIEVARLEDALQAFTGKSFAKPPTPLRISPVYYQVMQQLATDLCNRTEDLRLHTKTVGWTNGTIYSLEVAANLSQNGAQAAANGSIYSAASYCFGANVRYRFVQLADGNPDTQHVSLLMDQTASDIAKEEQLVDQRGYKTFTDLQAYLVVKERLTEAEDNLADANVSLNLNRTEDAIFSTAYAMERLSSAFSWDQFYGKGEGGFTLDKASVQASCTESLHEAEERFQYVRMYLPDALAATQRDLDRARVDALDGNYELCLYRASKAKAEVDLVLNFMGLTADQLAPILQARIEAARESIADQQAHGVFPIVGYSYYEYSKSLEDSDIYSSFLYSGYALELSNLDLYLRPSPQRANLVTENIYPLILGMIIGVLIGATIMALILVKGVKRKTKRVRKR